ncbi:S41 family peptidase [Arsenicibacter rosenii]|uniref:Peptidase S41 n=1 Tax=Arsenicibacter rosenii TaxID=1750698 RepID=A0A1S2VIM3_9BACT|nr:S41 family peptidase [Arsenicibacter rosenii]OIN57698.1 peptidase S41 [Arsenicibacter rosenii]
MNFVKLLLLFSWICVMGMSAQAQILSPQAAREDMAFLKHKLDAYHPGVGYYTPLARYEYLYDSLYNTLTASTDYLTFFQRVTPLVNSLKDGHTNLNHRRQYINKQTLYIPFYLRSVEDRYYVTHNMAADTSIRRGSEVLTINGRTMKDLHQILMDSDHSGSDGDNLTGRRQWSLYQFADYYATWFGTADSVVITYRLPADTLARQRTIKGVSLTQFRNTFYKRYRAEADRRPNLSVRIVDSLTRTAVLRVSTFMSPKKHDPFQLAFKRKLKKSFADIKAAGIENLIVDLQNNGGGLVLNSARLLQYWMPKSYRMMEKEHMKRAARAELVTRWNPFSMLDFHLHYKADGQGGFASRAHNRLYSPRKKLAFKGNLYFLMNGASFSATTSVLAKSLDAGVGTFVGEACGGAYWGDFAGQFKTVTLPNSRLQVRIPLKKLTHAVVAENANGFTVEPDFSAQRTYQDVLSGNDYMTRTALELIRKGTVARKPGTFRSFQASR